MNDLSVCAVGFVALAVPALYVAFRNVHLKRRVLELEDALRHAYD